MLPSDFAHDLREQGLHVFPLGTPGEEPPGWFVKRFETSADPMAEARTGWPKAPRIKWAEYQHREPTDAEFDGWVERFPGCNWGLATGVKVVVVDADTAEGVEFMRSGAVPVTPYQVLTSKGAHFYYRVNPDYLIRNGAGKHLDIRGQGGYVVCEGSVHASGHVYARHEIPGLDADIAELPMLAADHMRSIEAFNKRDEVMKGLQMPFDAEGNFSFDVQAAPKEASGGLQNPLLGIDSWAAPGSRNNTAAALAGKFIAHGDDLMTVKAKLDTWNEHNPVPLSQDELNHTIASITQTHTRKNPNKPIALVAEPPKPLETVALMDLFSLMDRSLDELPPYQVEGLIRAGDNVVVGGPPKSQKSMLLQDLLFSMAWGQPFLPEGVADNGADDGTGGFACPEPLRVAWVQAEMPWHETKRRADAHPRARERRAEATESNLFVTDRLQTMCFDDRGVEHMIEAILARFEGEIPNVLAIDSLAAVYDQDEESANTQMQRFLRERVGAFRAAFGDELTVIFVHHTAKMDRKAIRADPFLALRGASSLRGWYSAGMVMFRDPDHYSSPARELHFELRGDAEPDSIQLQYKDGWMQRYEPPMIDEEALTLPLLEEAIINFLTEHRGHQFVMQKPRNGSTAGDPYLPEAMAKHEGRKLGSGAGKRRVAELRRAMMGMLDRGILEIENRRNETRKTGSKYGVVIAEENKE